MARPNLGEEASLPSPSPSDLIPLAQAPRELRASGGLICGDRNAWSRVRYQPIYGLVVDGTIPAERVGGRWAIRRRDLPAVAMALGLNVQDAALPATVAELA
jgi:hypothetical protein